MKKTLVALAALATVGAAFAQSTVTLYGKIDWTIQNQTQSVAGVKTAIGNSGMQVNSAGLSGSRWGMKGSEDLGGGMKAVFDLQSGFAIDSGASAQGGLLFGRQAYAGLSGGFGTLTAGRQYSPIDTVWGTYDGQGYTTNSAMSYAWNGGLGGLTAAGATTTTGSCSAAVISLTSNPTFCRGIHAEPGRINNSLLYTTPAMGGFQAQFMYAPGENKVASPNATAQSAGSYTGFLVGYANGPLGVHLGYENIKSTIGGTAAVAAGSSFAIDNRAKVGGVANPLFGTIQPNPAAAATTGSSFSVRDWTLAASYNLGVATLYGGYQRATATGGSSDKGWMLGTAIPVGAMTLNLGYARETDAVTGLAVDGRNSAFGGQLVYPLSKRTNVYADFLDGKSRLAAATSAASSATQRKNTIYGIGLRHDF